MASLWVEPTPFTSHLDEKLRRREPRRAVSVQALERANDSLGTEGIHVAEWAAAEWREPDAEHGANVTVSRRAKHAFLETGRPLFPHAEHPPALNLVPWQLGSPLTRRQQVVDRRVDTALLAGVVVLVEAALP